MILHGIEGTPASCLAAMTGIPSSTSITGQDTDSDDSREKQPRLTCDQVKQIGTQNYQRALAMVKVHPTGRIILTEIVATYSIKGDYYQAVQALADRVALCKRTVQRWLKKLKNLGLIEVVRRIGTTSQIFPKCFEKLTDFMEGKGSSLREKQPDSDQEADEEYYFNGKKFSLNEIREYIQNKAAKFGKTKSYSETLWRHFKNGTLDLSDFEQFVPANTNGAHIAIIRELISGGEGNKLSEFLNNLQDNNVTIGGISFPTDVARKMVAEAIREQGGSA